MLGGILILICMNAGAIEPAGATATPAPTTFESRFENLQSSRDCIHNAKTKSEIEKCRGSIQIKPERVHVQ